MKKFLPLLLLALLPLGFTSCEDDPWEEEMMGEYWSDDANSVHFVLGTNKRGFVEYGDGTYFEFYWWATPDYLYFNPVDGPDFNCRYRWNRDGQLIIYDFDQWGDLYLWPERFYRSPKSQAPTE